MIQATAVIPADGVATFSGAEGRDRLLAVVRSRFDASISATETFFKAEADSISATALAMALRFRRGGRLLVIGEGADATDAQHVSVEFVHPVIVGKRALPSVALTNDMATLTAGSGSMLAAMTKTLGRSDDIALGLGAMRGTAVSGALEVAGAMGMLIVTIDSATGAAASAVRGDHRYVVPVDDPLIGQEVSETLYHVLWELVHLFFEHGVGCDHEANGQGAVK